MTGRESAHEAEVQMVGPEAAIIIGTVKKQVIDNSNVNVKLEVECDDGTKFDKYEKMTLKSTTYSQVHFTSKTAPFRVAKDCGDASDRCLANINGAYATNKTKLIDEFEQCIPTRNGGNSGMYRQP